MKLLVKLKAFFFFINLDRKCDFYVQDIIKLIGLKCTRICSRQENYLLYFAKYGNFVYFATKSGNFVLICQVRQFCLFRLVRQFSLFCQVRQFCLFRQVRQFCSTKTGKFVLSAEFGIFMFCSIAFGNFVSSAKNSSSCERTLYQKKQNIQFLTQFTSQKPLQPWN